MPPDSELETTVADWRLENLRLLAETPTSHVYRATRDGKDCVLKVFTDFGRTYEGLSGVALGLFCGRGGVDVLAHSPAALLLDYLPGPDLGSVITEHGDDEAARLAASLLSDLHTPALPAPALPTGADFPQLGERFLALNRDGPPELAGLITRAREVASDLLAAPGPQALLHGDLHHQNILRAGDGRWRLIDPQPIIGERTYDAANLLSNPRDNRCLIADPERIRRHAHLYARALETDPNRMIAFGFVHACVSICWSLEDQTSVHERPAAAATMLALL